MWSLIAALCSGARPEACAQTFVVSHPQNWDKAGSASACLEQGERPFAGEVSACFMVILAPVGVEAMPGLIDEDLSRWVALCNQGFHPFDRDAAIEAAKMGDRRAFRSLIGKHGGHQAAIIP